VLEKFYTKDIFRAGFTLFDQVSKQAKKLVARLGGVRMLALFDENTAGTLSGLQSFPPRMYKGLAVPGSVDLVEPMTYGEVQMVKRRVDQAEAVMDYMRKRFEFQPIEGKSVEGLNFEAVFNTAAARSLLYGSTGIAPLVAEDVRRFIDLFLKDPQVLDGLRAFAMKEAGTFFNTEPEKAGLLREFVGRSINALAGDLASIDTSKGVDIRFIGERLLVVGE